MAKKLRFIYIDCENLYEFSDSLNGANMFKTKRKYGRNIIYQCSYCCYQGNYRTKLKRHLQSCLKNSAKLRENPKRIVITSGAVFKCEYCPFLTNTLDKLVQHKKTHQDLINVGLIECSHCNLNFLTIEECKKHMINSSLHTNRDKIDTPDCVGHRSVSLEDNEDTTIKTKNCSDEEAEELPSETEKQTEKLPLEFEDFNGGLAGVVHKANGFYSCPCKKFRTKYLSYFLHHVRATHKTKTNKGNSSNSLEENSLACIICSRETSNELQLVLHMALDHVSPGRLFACPKSGCSFKVLEREELKLHLIDVHRLKESNFGFSINCLECLYGTESKTLMRAHELYNHPKRGDSPFHCPWPGCDTEVLYKLSLKRHLLKFHGIKVEVTYIQNQGWDVKGNLLKCSSCNLQLQTEFQMTIHNIFAHSTNRSKFACPTPHCPFTSLSKLDLKRHLMQEHKLTREYFRDYRVVNTLTSKKFENCNEVVEESMKNFFELPEEIEYEYRDSPDCESKHQDKKRYRCDLCQFSTDYKISARQHQKHVHGKQRCQICKKALPGKYALFWHQTFVHKYIVSKDEWGMMCTLCFEEPSPEEYYKHGIIHKCDTVTFQTLYRNVPTGYLTFHYGPEGVSRTVVVKKQEPEPDYVEVVSDNDYINEKDKECSAASAIKVLDWTMSDDEENVSGTLAQLKKADTVTIEFSESDNEFGGSNRNAGTDNLLVMKSEFLTCKQCTYEAKNLSVLSSHVLLMHAEKVEQYRCPEEDCEYNAKYAGSFKRHLINAHKLTPADLFGLDEKGDVRKIKKKNNEKGKSPKMTYAWKRYKDEHQLDSDPEWEPLKDQENQDSKQKYQCPEKRCPFTTAKKSELLRHHREKHNILKFSKTRYFCPNQHCIYTADRKSQLKNHLEVFHEIEKHKVSDMEKIILSMKKIVCSLCDYQTKDGELFKTHLRNKHRRYIVNERAITASSDQKTLAEQNKWHLKCVMCPYETSSKRAAYKHGYQHYRSDRTVVGIFRKLYKDQQRGILKFRYSSKNRHRCSKCPYVGLTTTHLLKHHVRYHKTSQKDAIKKEIETKSEDISNILIKSADEGATTQEENKIITNKCTPQELPQIIEITSEIPLNTTDPDSDKIPKQNEIIRIEVIEDAADELSEDKFPCSMCKLVAPDKQSLKIHAINEHLTTESQEKQQSTLKNKNAGKITFKCSMCGKSLVNLATLENHTYMHARLKNNFDIKVKYSKFKGNTLVDTLIVKANSKHIPRERRTNRNLIYNPDLSAHIPGRTSFKCWMCGEIFVNKVTLDNHTYIHAREEDNFDIKVRYSIFKGDTIVNTIVIKADPNYKPREKRAHRDRSPALDYDPDLPVFSCNECNFKTNDEATLTKHKGLHWSSEKEAAFKAQKWYTCGVCFFHCFDIVKFKEHGEKHRERNVPGAKIDVKKMSQNSWSF